MSYYSSAKSLVRAELYKEIKDVKPRVRWRLSQISDTWWSKNADDIQAAVDSSNIRLFYGPTSSLMTPLRGRNGKELGRDSQSILQG